MLFKNCNSIHMMGMKIPLDIVFLDTGGTIIKCISELQPWRAAICLKGSMTLELPAQSIEKKGLAPDMKLEIREC